jgi:addiction module RelB/DinJ family antitoxin
MAGSTLFRARVPTERLRRAEKVFARLGMKPGDAFNIFLAQVELRNDLPFAVTTTVDRLDTTEEQGKVWENALGEY